MADEEIQRAIEFIVQQQAKYAARLEKDAPRLAMLEESFKMLVELAEARMSAGSKCSQVGSKFRQVRERQVGARQA